MEKIWVTNRISLTLKCIHDPGTSHKFPRYPLGPAAIIFGLDYRNQSSPLKFNSWHSSALNSPIVPICPGMEVKVLSVVYMPALVCLLPSPPPHLSLYLSPTLPTVYSSFARPTSLLFLKYAKHPPTSGPLYLSFLVRDMLFLDLSTRLTASHPSGLFSISSTSLPALYKLATPTSVPSLLTQLNFSP